MTVINIKGWDELEKKLRGNALFEQPFRDLFEEMARYGVTQLNKRAPKGKTRVLSSSNRVTTNTHMAVGRLNWWVKFTNDATRQGGYRYGFALNAGRRKTKAGYTEFHRARTGASTKAWFTGLTGSLRNRIRANTKKTILAIEGRWKGR